MKKEFSAYEFVGVLVPGGTVFLCAALVNQQMRDFIASGKFDVGELGLFVIGSYVVGHLIQGFGNILEKGVWAFRGMPSTWIRKANPSFLSNQQRAQLRPALTRLLGHEVSELSSLDERTCNGIRGQLYARLQQAGRTDRLDSFNGNYGMFRGIATAVLLGLIGNVFAHGYGDKRSWILAVVAVVALMRMHRFGVHYAAELYRQALNLAHTTKGEAAT